MKKFLKKIKKGLNRVIKTIARHKGISLGILCGILVLIAAIGIGVSFSNKNKEETTEEKLSEILESIGRDWYENHYYDALENNETPREEFLKKFNEIGFKVNLNNLALHSAEGIDEKIAKFENKNCDKEETKVIIYPQEPYGLKDYKIETIVQCNNKKDENK